MDKTLADLRSNVLKERKNGKMNIDMSAIGTMQPSIDKLTRLAQNTKVFDLIYENASNMIASSKHTKGDKSMWINQLETLMADKDNLTELTTDELRSKALQVVRESIDKISIVKKNLNFGENSISYKNADGSGLSQKTSTIGYFDSEGNLQFDDEKFSSAVDASMAKEEIELSEDEKNAIKMTLIAEMSSARSSVAAPEKNQLDEEFKRLRNQNMRESISAAKRKVAGEDEEPDEVDPLKIASQLITNPTNENQAVMGEMLTRITSGMGDVLEIKKGSDFKKDSGIVGLGS